jgi:hypothetical protein
MKEISRVIGVSESRVCQLHMQAIMHLRTALGQGEGKVVKKGVVVPLAAKERRVLKQQAKIVDENVVIRKRIRSQRRVS